MEPGAWTGRLLQLDCAPGRPGDSRDPEPRHTTALDAGLVWFMVL